MQKLLEERELTIKQPYFIRWLGVKRTVEEELVYDCFASIWTTLSKLMVDVHAILEMLSCQLQVENLQ